MEGLVCIASLPHSDHSDIHRAMVKAAGEQHVVLDTCERLETYAYFPNPGRQEENRWLTYRGEADINGVSVIRGNEVAQRLLRIASGLESRIIGEPHVLGQVRIAFVEGQQLRRVGTVLSSLFCSGIRTGRRVRNETNINAGRDSVVTLTVRKLLEGLQPLQGKSIGILGSGAIARDIVQNLLQYGAGDLRVYSKHQERAILRKFSGDVVVRSHADMTRELPQLDAIIACSRAAQPILREPDLEECKPDSIVIDLGSPANIAYLDEPPNHITLTRLADLRRSVPASELLSAERIVAEESGKFENWCRQRRVAGTIQRLVRDADLPPTRSTPTLHAKIMQVKAQVAA